MSDLSCAIVKDLIPSYLEDICSQESKMAVDAHLAECQECRRHVEILRQTDFVVGRSDQRQKDFAMKKSDQKQLDFMKKTKEHYARKSSLGAALLFGLCVLVLPVISNLNPDYEEELYYVIFTVLSIGSYLLLSNYQKKPETHWALILSAIVTVIGIVYSSGLMAFLYRTISTDANFFGKALYAAGPLANRLLIFIIILELAAFALYAADSVQKKHAFSILPSLNLACCFLCLSYRRILFFMDSKSTIPAAILQSFQGFLLLASCILLVEFVIWKIRRRKDHQIWGGA